MCVPNASTKTLIHCTHVLVDCCDMWIRSLRVNIISYEVISKSSNLINVTNLCNDISHVMAEPYPQPTRVPESCFRVYIISNHILLLNLCIGKMAINGRIDWKCFICFTKNRRKLGCAGYAIISITPPSLLTASIPNESVV